MKKRIIFALVALLTLAGCQKQATESESQTSPQQEQEASEPAADENAYIDIIGVTPAGEELSLSSLVGKTDYVMVDFWASWCNPCRQFVPVLKEIYGSQPEGRLEILSCSVDQDVMAWQVALNEEQMPWPQMREDETHPCSDKYNVQYIPYTVLIDKEGRIVGVNLEEPQLEEILLGE